MKILNRAFNFKEDYNNVINFLRELYLENRRQKGWLAQRFEDMEYRVNPLYMEWGKENWHPCIRLWENDGIIVGVAVGEEPNNLCPCIKENYELIFNEMLDWKEDVLKDKNKKLIVAIQDCQKYFIDELINREYILHKELTYCKSQNVKGGHNIKLPEGYSIISGYDTQNAENIIKKYRSLHLGFHPEKEGDPNYINVEAISFWVRERAPMFNYRYEIMTKNDDDEICSYMYTWVDKKTSTAYIEPVSTRKAHRRKGLAKAMIYKTLDILAEDKIEKCFVNPYNDERNVIYSACGFNTDNIEYWYEKMI